MSVTEATSSSRWLSTLDQKSGRTYYYNTRSKETTWTKPIELASPAERESILKKKYETKRFFEDMEANIINKLKRVLIVHEDTSQNPGDLGSAQIPYWTEFKSARNISPNMRPTAYNRVRTISSLDDEILAIMASSRNFKESIKTERDRDRESKCSSIEVDERTEYSKEQKERDHDYDANNNNSNKNNKNNNSNRNLSSQSESKDDCDHRLGNIINNMHNEKLDTKDDLEILKACRRTRSFRVNTRKNSRAGSPGLKRRNSTGTIYLGTTMSSQDNQSTIHCVCAVIQMHMLEASREGMVPHSDYDIFKDRNNKDQDNGNESIHDNGNGSRNGNGNVNGGHNYSYKEVFQMQNNSGNGTLIMNNTVPFNYTPERTPHLNDKIPSLATIKDFFLLIFSKSQLESECIIMSLIYVERLTKDTRGKLCLRPNNWKSILFACLVMASKVWDDLSMWNVDFSHVCPSFDLQRVNSLELSMLEALKYLIRVSAGEYAKYYFHLRSMMSKLGLKDNEPFMLAPLDVKGARRLQLVTEAYQENKITTTGSGVKKLRPRSYTIVSGAGLDKMKHRLQSQDTYEQSPVGVVLEQLVHNSHVDADGQQHATPAVAKYRSEREFNSSVTFAPTRTTRIPRSRP